ncbi:MAG: IS1595 family transposase [Desulfobulbus sp.]|nr:IS1595 family transposase [Desulfobulbus sp.]
MEKTEHQQQLSILQTFERLFPTEEDCIEFLFPLRWPQGFICPFCRTRHPQMSTRRYPVCPHCGNRSSLTTGTLMHGAKKPLRDWLLTIWWFSAAPFDVSAKELQRLLGLSCYQTAWTWLQKLRLAMGRADNEPCKGVVEVICDTVAPAYERKERAQVLTAAEIVLSLNITGRIRMRHIERLNHETLMLFLKDSLQPNSTLLTADKRLLELIPEAGPYNVAPAQPAPSAAQPSRTQELNRSFETCLHTVHRGGVTVKHLQLYLDEFCFRNNASLLPDHQAVFRALLHGVLAESITDYRKVVQSGAASQGRQAKGGLV